jgi:protein-tyrosine kinase
MTATFRDVFVASKRADNAARRTHRPAQLTVRAAQGRDDRSPEIALLVDPNGPQSEATRALRAHILTSHHHRGRRALVVCAASEGAGCTQVAVNLAVALRQAGLKVLLIDADLRQPAVQRYFPSMSGSPGLYECLQWPDTVVPGSISTDPSTDLSIMPAGDLTREAPDLLSADRLKPLLDRVQREFDITIIDTPPANTCSDAGMISSVAGYSLIVARRDASFVSDVKTLASELRRNHAIIVGNVLNEG